MLGPLRELNTKQWRAFIAAFLGWTLDAFDFFLVTFVVSRIATDFNRAIPEVAFAITITLMLRPLGALIFGMFADKYGRRGPLMASVLIYSVVELATAFSPNFTIFIVLRGLYGIAMGGEWGVGAALALETLPVRARGLASGILQQGYATGYLIAAAVFGLFFETIGWRGMFVVGCLPALLVLYIRSQVEESPSWQAGQAKPMGERLNLWTSFLKQPMLYVYAILLMAAFNFLSHGSQDLYPTFLTKQREFDPHTVALVTIIVNIGAILGGTLFGGLSQRFGRKRTILAACVFGICTIPLWIGAPNIALLAFGGFLIQFFVQGAWGVIPAHLNELSPGDVRGTFPGFTYQLGNLISAGSAQIEAAYAATLKTPNGGADYAHALMVIMIGVFIAVFILTAIGPERRGVSFVAEPVPATG
jgi:SHS family lactate transporter-like MFS transporter